MIAKSNKTCGTKRYIFASKEEEDMIKTDEHKMYGQLEEQANTGDIEAFVFRNGEVVPADQAENTTGPVIHTASEKNYGQLEEQANGNADIEAFVFKDGEVVPATEAGKSTGPMIRTPREHVYAVSESNEY